MDVAMQKPARIWSLWKWWVRSIVNLFIAHLFCLTVIHYSVIEYHTPSFCVTGSNILQLFPGEEVRGFNLHLFSFLIASWIGAAHATCVKRFALPHITLKMLSQLEDEGWTRTIGCWVNNSGQEDGWSLGGGSTRLRRCDIDLLLT